MQSKTIYEHTGPIAESPPSIVDHEFENLLDTLAERVAAVSALVNIPYDSTITPSIINSLDEDTASVATIPFDSRYRCAEMP